MPDWTSEDQAIDDFIDWCDDAEGQDLEILLAGYNAFPGIPTLAELVILKREMAKLFPVGEAQRPAPTLRKRPKPLMAWNAARVRQVEKQALERGVDPWEVVEIKKKSWQIGLRKLRAKAPTPS